MLPVDAANYVPRAADQEIVDILTAGRAHSSIVIAPISGGTTSFLVRVYEAAKDLSNCWACFVDFAAAFPESRVVNLVDLFKYLLIKLEMSEEALKNLDFDGMKDAFRAWAPEAWSGLSQVTLIVDGLEQVYRRAGSPTDVLPLLNWFAALRSDAALGEPPLNKLILVTSLAGSVWSAAHASPYSSQTSQLWLKKFTEPEVALLFRQLKIETGRDDIAEVHNLFHGQPFLTQLFGWSMRDGASLHEAKDKAFALEDAYETHWERMKSEIEFLIGTTYPIDQVLAVVLTAVPGPTYDSLGSEAARIWNNYHRNLRVFGLVDRIGTQTSICEFYRNAIETNNQINI